MRYEGGLGQPPAQMCGTDHWLSQPCPKGECPLLVFENDTVKVRAVTKVVSSVHPDVKPDRLEVAVKKEAMTNAERQKQYRERKRQEREG